jgi:hypothetical protein
MKVEERNPRKLIINLLNQLMKSPESESERGNTPVTRIQLKITCSNVLKRSQKEIKKKIIYNFSAFFTEKFAETILKKISLSQHVLLKQNINIYSSLKANKNFFFSFPLCRFLSLYILHLLITNF